MFLRSKTFLIKVTLFCFIFMVCYNPVYAGSPDNSALPEKSVSSEFPVTYVTQQQALKIISEARKQGYEIKEGSLLLLAELTQAQQQNEQQEDVQQDTDSKDCATTAKKTVDDKNSDKENKLNKKSEAENSGGDKPDKKTSDPCASETEQNTTVKDQSGSDPKATPMAVEMPNPEPGPQPPPEPLPPPQPPQQTQVQTNVGVYADVSYGRGHGSSSDVGKVFFIVAGIMVVAAFIVYAGKYISDLVAGKDMKTWWEFVFTSTYLSTRSGQHGRLYGVKVGTGFVSSDLIQVALIGEFGNTDIDVILDEYNNPEPLNFSASYWMLGATARLHLTDKLVNASYLYIDFMGGATSDSATDTIGMARMGASFGIGDNVRLGGSFGAHYIGLDEDQGFVNNDDNYWTTFGIEMGMRF